MFTWLQPSVEGLGEKVDNLLGDDCHMCQSRKLEKQVV